MFLPIVYILGGPPLCAYLLILLYKLSPEESSKDPFYFVLVRRAKSDATQHTWRLSVVTMRVIFSIASCLMLSVLCYTIIVEGSPLHAEIYRECMIEIVQDHFVRCDYIGVDCIQGIKLDDCFLVDNFTLLFWEHCYVCIHTVVIVQTLT